VHFTLRCRQVEHLHASFSTYPIHIILELDLHYIAYLHGTIRGSSPQDLYTIKIHGPCQNQTVIKGDGATKTRLISKTLAAELRRVGQVIQKAGLPHHPQAPLRGLTVNCNRVMMSVGAVIVLLRAH
jgi:hypothetical protein